MEYKKYNNSNALKVSRREMKYFISIVDYNFFKNTFSAVLNEDKYNIPGGYKVRSLYFDSIHNIDYHDKVEGEEFRKKIRIRIYSPYDTTAKLEVKYKFNLTQRKESLIISREDAKELINCNYDVLLKYNDILAQKVYGIMKSMLYKPVVVVEYNREAFFHKEYGIRATLDTNIMANENTFDIFSDSLSFIPVLDFINPVLEVKYDKYIYNWFQELISQKSCTISSISKYCRSRQFYENYLA